jgi:hypothetical protein
MGVGGANQRHNRYFRKGMGVMIAFTDSRMVNGAFSCLQEFVAALSFPGELQKLTCRQSSILIDATRYLQPLTSLSLF